MIPLRTALILYALLAALALATKKGKMLALALLIVGALAAKTLLHHFRERS